MTFQERVKKLENYRPDISFRDGAFILKMRFNPNWRVIEPSDKERIALAADNSIDGLWWYVVKIEDIDELFDLIDDTISANVEMEKKSELYKKKVEELKELFLSDVSYEKLCQLQFTYNKPKKPKTVKARKDATPETVETAKIESLEVEGEKSSVTESEIDIKVKKAIGK